MSEILTPDLCVIGAGAGGLSVAAGAARLGVPVVLIEKGEMGGDCLNTGCVPSKTLIASAAIAQAMRDAGRFGIHAVEPRVEWAAVRKRTTKDLRADTRLLNLFRTAIEAASDDSGWAHLGAVGTNIVKQAPEFDPRNYGFKKLGELAASIGLFEVDRKSHYVLIRDSLKQGNGD